MFVACGVQNEPYPPGVAVASTNNPLVAQYTVTSGCVGRAMVEFGVNTSYGRQTSWQPVGHYKPITILVAGMRPSTTYHMQSIVQCTVKTFTSADQTFTTGPLPSTPFPSMTVTRLNGSSKSAENPGIELVNIFAPGSKVMQGFFVDRDANPIWYYDVGAAQGNAPYTMKLLPNGDMLFSITQSVTAGTVLREVDLAGNTIREMGTGQLDTKMQQAGFNFVPTGFHHDVLVLPNGHLIVLVNFYQGFTDLPGYPGTTNVLGDGLVDLDQNWNPVWAWSAFDHLDVNRHPNGLPDWTHSNAVIYSPNDGDLLLSIRHQSWIIKIDYENGQGDGNILWRLGYQGDFALKQGDDPSLWYYYQHFPALIAQNGSQTSLAVWDNGNNRVLDAQSDLCTNPAASQPNPCHSRAVIFSLDESTRVASLDWSYSPGYWSIWGGSVLQLNNGDVEFDMNAPAFPPIANLAAEVQEVTKSSSPKAIWKLDISPVPLYAYRAYRVPSLYPNVAWHY